MMAFAVLAQMLQSAYPKSHSYIIQQHNDPKKERFAFHARRFAAVDNIDTLISTFRALTNSRSVAVYFGVYHANRKEVSLI